MICLECNREIKEGESLLWGYKNYNKEEPMADHIPDGRAYHTRCVENKTEKEVHDI